MRHGGQKIWNQRLGPRALAVVSCALALLAAQPSGMTAAKGQGVAAVRLAGGSEGAEGAGNAPCEMRNVEAPLPRVAERREREEISAAPRGGGSRLHVLATVEMLKRWLAFELRPLERQVLPALVFAPVSTGEAAGEGEVRFVIVRARGDVPAMGVERAFAIARCLLAPPEA